MTEQRAKWWRERIELAASTMTDKDASQSAELFRELKQDGSLIAAGTRINWNGTVKRAAVDLWDTAENTPEAAPELWEDIAYRDGIRIIPQTITVGTAFAKDELGWWGDLLYKSLVEPNVYTPEEYPQNWELLTQIDEEQPVVPDEPTVEPEEPSDEPEVELQAEPEYKTIYRNATVDQMFNNGEIGIWEDGKLYKSLINANIYTPETYPMGWELVP